MSSRNRRCRRLFNIYFVEAVGLNRIKIGLTENVKTRLPSIQTGCPVPIRLLLTVKGRIRDERALHLRFSDACRIGEWFETVPDLLQFIEALSAVSPKQALTLLAANPLPLSDYDRKERAYRRRLLRRHEKTVVTTSADSCVNAGVGSRPAFASTEVES